MSDDPMSRAIQQIEFLTHERDEARRELLMWLGERMSRKELKHEIKQRGWEYLNEDRK